MCVDKNNRITIGCYPWPEDDDDKYNFHADGCKYWNVWFRDPDDRVRNTTVNNKKKFKDAFYSLNEEEKKVFESIFGAAGMDNKKETNMNKKFYVTDVITHNNKVVIVKFSDGTFTKSICSDNDTFDIDVGISICLLKRLLCGEGKAEDANRNYNNLIRKIHKKMAKKEADKAEALKAKKERREKQAAKERKNEARKNKEREEFVDDVYKGVKKAVLLLKEENGE